MKVEYCTFSLSTNNCPQIGCKAADNEQFSSINMNLLLLYYLHSGRDIQPDWRDAMTQRQKMLDALPYISWMILGLAFLAFLLQVDVSQADKSRLYLRLLALTWEAGWRGPLSLSHWQQMPKFYQSIVPMYKDLYVKD